MNTTARAGAILGLALLAACQTTGPMASAPPIAAIGAQPATMGNAEMLPTRSVIQNLAASAEHRTLVAGFDRGGIARNFETAGPFTVFAPTDSAFSALPPAISGRMMQDQSRSTLATVLNNHVLRDRVNAAALRERIRASGGAAVLQTDSGSPLVARLDQTGAILLTDAQGNVGRVTTPDVLSANGVVHAVDRVLLPSATLLR